MQKTLRFLLPLLPQALEALSGGIGCRTLQRFHVGFGFAEHAR